VVKADGSVLTGKEVKEYDDPNEWSGTVCCGVMEGPTNEK
jgi:hypothetical protein